MGFLAPLRILVLRPTQSVSRTPRGWCGAARSGARRMHGIRHGSPPFEALMLILEHDQDCLSGWCPPQAAHPYASWELRANSANFERVAAAAAVAGRTLQAHGAGTVFVTVRHHLRLRCSSWNTAKTAHQVDTSYKLNNTSPERDAAAPAAAGKILGNIKCAEAPSSNKQVVTQGRHGPSRAALSTHAR